MQRRAKSFEATRAVLHGVSEVSLAANAMSSKTAVVAASGGSKEPTAIATAAMALAHTTRDLAQRVAMEISTSEHFLPKLAQIRQLVERMQCLTAPSDGTMPGLRGIEETSGLSEAASRQMLNGQD